MASEKKTDTPEIEHLMSKATQLTKRGLRQPRKALVRKDKPEPNVQKEALKLLDKVINPPVLKQVMEANIAKMDPSAVYLAFQNFEDAVGGRTKLLETLAHCPANSTGYNMLQRLVLDPDFLILVQGEGDEEKLKFSLEAICSKNKIPFSALIAGFKDARVAQLTIEALTTVGEKSQQVIEQVADAATNRWVECTNCKGTKRVKRIGDNGEFAVDELGNYVTQLCWICRGEGQVYASHDWQNRNKFLEIVGITKKEPLIQNTIDNRSVTIGGTTNGLEGTMKALDNLLRGKMPQRTQEAEIIDVQPESNS